MAKIRSDCIRKPANPTPENYQPPQSQRRTVGRGINFSKIAQKELGIHPWALIRFNFPSVSEQPSQQGGREVNWYLQEYLGCTLVTQNRKNYMFDGTMKRPFIYIPITSYNFEGDIIEVGAPSYAWGGFGWRDTRSQQPFAEVETYEQMSGVLFSLDRFENHFGVNSKGTRYGLRLHPAPLPTHSLVALIATGLTEPIKLNGYALKGFDFSVSLGPIGKALKSASVGWKLRKVGKVAVKAALTMAEWEKTRSIFTEAIKTIPKINLKSKVPKLHIIELISLSLMEVSIYYLKSKVEIVYTHGKRIDPGKSETQWFPNQ